MKSLTVPVQPKSRYVHGPRVWERVKGSGFNEPPRNDLPFSNYENCDMVRLDSNRTETIFGYTKKNVVGG